MTIKLGEYVGIAGILAGGIGFVGYGYYWFDASFDKLEKCDLAQKTAIVKYGDRNNDGIITHEEQLALMGDIARVNSFIYDSDNQVFYDREGKELSLEHKTEMFNNYKPAK